MAPYEALYGRKCHTPLCWTELGERWVLGPKLVSKMEISCKGKLSPRFIGSYRILKCVGPIAYQLELPPKLDCIHDVFHVSTFRRYQFDPSQVVSVEEIEVRQDLTFEEEPIQILEHDIKVLGRKSSLLVKVLWQNHGTKEALWEPEDSMHQLYPHLLESGKFRGLLLGG
ncbi:uncharacterized protein LOC105767033 [Gossypium raimondii]|uniref:uncharacterized protein LOC105767033 n=1 Tax=Gossypium raimondii TaxID=29730 RepID=UPI00063AD0DC|nr:uncharacterized protein LOC105767033 [Gossypium raimondii]